MRSYRSLRRNRALRSSIPRKRFVADSPLEGDGLEPSVPPREKPTSSAVETRSPERLAAGTGCRCTGGYDEADDGQKLLHRLGAVALNPDQLIPHPPRA